MSYITMRDGRQVEVSSIVTIQGATDALDHVENSIIAIEEQIERATIAGDADPEWLIRTKTALKHRCRSRAALQGRIGQLRRAEKADAHDARQSQATTDRLVWSRAFVNAARAKLTGEEFRILCKRADELVEAEA